MMKSKFFCTMWRKKAVERRDRGRNYEYSLCQEQEDRCQWRRAFAKFLLLCTTVFPCTGDLCYARALLFLLVLVVFSLLFMCRTRTPCDHILSRSERKPWWNLTTFKIFVSNPLCIAILRLHSPPTRVFFFMLPANYANLLKDCKISTIGSTTLAFCLTTVTFV